MKRNLFKKLNTPYYIYSFGWNNASAGNMVMHYLCHALNLSGETAYMFALKTNPELKTPLVSTVPTDGNFIGVYPEILVGNAMKARTVVRYVLYYPGKYDIGGEVFDNKDIMYTYHEKFYPSVPILTIPVSDPNIFYRDDKVRKDITTCFYGRNKGCVTSPFTKDSIEITDVYPKTKKELAQLLRRSKIFYTYVQSSLIDEATLCGTTVRYIPNMNMIKEDIVKPSSKEKILKREDIFWKQLDRFIEDTQRRHREVA